MERSHPIAAMPDPDARVLVTGASGFIGSHLVRALCAHGSEVHAVSRTEQSQQAAGLQWWRCDLEDGAAARSVIERVQPDIIFHLASQVYGSRERSAVMPTFNANLVSTLNILLAAADCGCRRVVLTGSQEEPTTPGQPPCSPYAAAKGAAGMYARMFHALYRLPVVVLRVFMVYGPGQRDLKKLIPYVVLALSRSEGPALTNGSRRIDWVYVEDVVRALLAAAVAQGIDGETIDVGSGNLVTIREVVEQLCHLMQSKVSPQFGALPPRPLEIEACANVERSIALLRWKPLVPLAEGLRRTVAWYAPSYPI
jgi:UDP-glucose 4-epimerase